MHSEYDYLTVNLSASKTVYKPRDSSVKPSMESLLGVDKSTKLVQKNLRSLNTKFRSPVAAEAREYNDNIFAIGSYKYSQILEA